MTFDLNTVLKDSFYMIASFDREGNIVYKNNKFNVYFPELKSKDDFMDILYEQETFGRNRKRIIVESPDMDGTIKFEINYSNGMSFYIGTKISYEEVIDLSNYIVLSEKKGRPSSKVSVVKAKMNAYATVMVDKDDKIKHITDNIYEILGEKTYLGKTLDEVFGSEVTLEIKNKINYLRVFDDVTLEIDGKLMVLSEVNPKYLVINIYPYSANVMNKLEEISYLKYKIKNLEKELDSRDKFIKAQKEVYKNISTVDSLTKLYTRRYLVEKYGDAVDKFKKHGDKFSLLSFSIENFKGINGDIGYDKADDLLKTLSILIRRTMNSEKDLAFRVSSSKFMVLSLDTTKEELKDRFKSVKNRFKEETGFELNVKAIDSSDKDAMCESVALSYIEE